MTINWGKENIQSNHLYIYTESTKPKHKFPEKRYSEETEYELPEFRKVSEEKKENYINGGKIGSIIRKMRQCEKIQERKRIKRINLWTMR